MQKAIHPGRILIADTDTTIRETVCLICEEDHHLTVVAEAANSQELLTLLRASHPDVVLLDWDLPGKPIIPLIQMLAKQHLQKVLVMGTRPETRVQALKAGADAFFHKGNPPVGLIHLLKQLIQDKP